MPKSLGTSYAVALSSAPAVGSAGNLYYNTGDGSLYKSNGSAWTVVGGGGGGPTLSDTPPGSPTAGMLWYETDTGILYVYYDSSWIEVGGAGIGGAVISATPPASPIPGATWFDSDTAITYIYYDSTWVEIGGAGVGGAIISDTAPTTPVPGVFWFKSDTAQMFLYYDSSWIEVGTSAPATDDTLLVHIAGTETITGAKTFSTTVILPAATTSISSLRIPHGAAPTTPTNGDVWTTTTGMFARINGATVGPFGAGGGGMSNPLTTNGDIIYGVGTTPTRLGIGTAGQALLTNTGATAPTWGTLTLENLPGAWTKRAARAATTANVATLAGGAPNVIDGVTLVLNDRVLVKDQTTQSQNGIYTVTTVGTGANGTWARAADADVIGEVCSSMVTVEEGTLAGGFTYDNDLKATDTLGTTNMPWFRVVDTCGATFAGAVVMAAGTTTLAPLKLTSGPVQTTAAAGSMEFDGDAAYFTPDSAAVGGRAVNVATHFYGLSATRNLTNGTGAQSIFGVGLTVAGSTTYEIEMVVAISSSGTTTAIKSLSFGGTATLTSIGYHAEYAHSATSVATTAAMNGFWVATAASTNMGATSTTNYSRYIVKGLVRVNASGTFIPNVAWSAAPGAAPVVQISSFVKMTPVGTNNVTTVGAWA